MNSPATGHGSKLADTTIVAVVLLAVSFITGDGGKFNPERQTIILPFVWRDIAAVSLLSAIPLAWLISEFVARRIPRISCIAFGLLLCGTVWLFFVRGISVDSLSTEIHRHAAVERPVVALTLAIGITLCLRAIHRRAVLDLPEFGLATWILHLLLAAIGFGLIPSTYVNARCRHDAGQVVELLKQSRIGESAHLLNRILALNFNYQHNGEPVRRIVSELKTTVEHLKNRVESQLSATATVDEQIERARELAMLGQLEQASATLRATGELESNPDICGLLAIISENQNQWETALDLYLNCQNLWQAMPQETRRSEGIFTSTRGIAFCCRKLGKIQQAEDEWLKLLQLSPTAATHFLLAQFYEDIQQTTKADEHATKAAELSPSRYRDKAEALVKKMRQLHFGCFRLHQSPGSRNTSGRIK